MSGNCFEFTRFAVSISWIIFVHDISRMLQFCFLHRRIVEQHFSIFGLLEGCHVLNLELHINVEILTKTKAVLVAATCHKGVLFLSFLFNSLLLSELYGNLFLQISLINYGDLSKLLLVGLCSVHSLLHRLTKPIGKTRRW